ncbi:Protein kinase-like domain protein [Cordyceps fumosorosea ARSEF 2679]|uniref:Protein kinase-like domain protein n=1 Tax=Cordyceps fumosorosea (strain ARSEF 2679) TaxID=1081104 RepID=A0A162ICF8_CORFA|nr:Protein kinase-like domain protein [Cordyceps fumosorosea ARSEF 2679]OAA55135.1 Protein kinase-like domain protein [Cordyceps fumosorosea ARSEF 2679]
MDQSLTQRFDLPPKWSVIDFSYSLRHSYAKFVVMCNHVRYVVHASDLALASAPDLRDKFLFFLDVAEHDTLNGYTIDHFYTWALAPLLPILRAAHQDAPPGSQAATLRDVLHAPITEYALEAEFGRLLLRPAAEENLDAYLMFGARLPAELCGPWPAYLPSHLRLDPRDDRAAVPRRVFLPSGAPAFFLLADALRAHARMRASALVPSVRVARLIGLVRDEDATVSGMLLTYVEGATGSLARAAEAGPGPGAAPERLRRRWSEQVMRTVHSLHQSGLVWGDARPKNVVIDGENNAWLVGFGGGYAAGWVPKELAGTVDGDLAALKRIIDYTEEGPPIESS